MYSRIYTLNYDGKIPSKKNQTRFTMGKGKHGKGFPRAYSSKEYKDFVEEMDSQFISQIDYPDTPLKMVHIVFNFKCCSEDKSPITSKADAILLALNEISILDGFKWNIIPEITISSSKSFRDGCTIKIMELENG